MRTCDGCTLCCKVERVPDLNKPSNHPCQYSNGRGCSIHGTHPKVCQAFFCGWITDETLDEDMRPDKAHLYIYGKAADGVLKITVDPDHPDAWKTGKGADVVQHVLQQGFHALVVVGKQINFLNGVGRPQPEKLIIDWLL